MAEWWDREARRVTVVLTTWIGLLLVAAVGGLVARDLADGLIDEAALRLEIDPQLEAALDQSQQIHGGDAPLSDLSVEQGRCVAERSPVGAQDLVGVLSDPSPGGIDLVEDFFRAVLDCVPEPWKVDSFARTFTRNLQVTVGDHAGIGLEEGRCLLWHIVVEAEDPALTLVSASTEDSLAVFIAGVERCFDDHSRRVVDLAPGTGPQAVGDDPGFDALHARCAAGDDPACDLLYIVAVEGSEYRTFAKDCAGRGDGVSYCTAGLATDDAGMVRPDSAGLPLLDGSCVDGDMVACDLLYAVSAVGSDFEHTGLTCGGRIALAVPDCRSRFP